MNILMKCNIMKHFINVYTDWSSEKKIHHVNYNLLPLDTYIETTQVYCTHQTERKKYKGLMVQWTHTCTHAWLQLQVGLMGWVRWTWQIPTELDRPRSWVVVPQQDVQLRTCSKFVTVCYAQVTHSRIGRRISHGYDPASFVAIRIGP